MDPEKTADVAAQWWMEQLQAEARALGGDLMDDAPAENLRRFKTVLREKLLACYNARGRFDWLSVDHYPDVTLRAALNDAEIEVSSTVLPWRTVMRFDADGVHVQRGYDAPWVTLAEGDAPPEMVTVLQDKLARVQGACRKLGQRLARTDASLREQVMLNAELQQQNHELQARLSDALLAKPRRRKET